MLTRCSKKANKGDTTPVAPRKRVKKIPAKSPAVGATPGPQIAESNTGRLQEEEIHAPTIMKILLDISSMLPATEYYIQSK